MISLNVFILFYIFKQQVELALQMGILIPEM